MTPYKNFMANKIKELKKDMENYDYFLINDPFKGDIIVYLLKPVVFDDPVYAYFNIKGNKLTVKDVLLLSDRDTRVDYTD